MKKTEIDWRQKAHAFLTAAKFENGRCHMKLYSRNSHRYLAFGVVYPDDICKIHLMEFTKNGAVLTGKVQEWNSIDEMLDAGWDVD